MAVVHGEMVRAHPADAAPAPAFVPGPLLRLPYPVRNVLRRWRGTVGMMIGVGIALGVAMTMLAVAQASVDIYTLDYLRSGATGYVITQGGTLMPILPSDGPGTIKRSRQVITQVRRLPGVTAAIGIMSWPLEREREGPRRADQPVELVLALGVDGDPSQIRNAVSLDEGRWLQRSDEVIVGPKLAREKKLHVGDTLRLSGRTFTIAGIGKLRGLGAGFAADTIAYIDHAALRQRADVGDIFSTIIVQSTQPDATRRQITALGSLLQIMGLLDRPTRGTVTFDGRDVSTLSDGERTRLRLTGLGFVFQRFHLLPGLSAVENVALPLEAAGVPAGQRYALAAALLTDMSLGDRLTFPPSELSGGQRQRVAIARALANGPKLILADEPTGSLHSEDRVTVLDLLRRFQKEGRTVVVVTHDPQVAATAERRVEIRDGRTRELAN